MEWIELAAFQACNGLTDVELPSSLTFVGDHAFYHCVSLMRVEIPASVTSIGPGAFGYASSTELIEGFTICGTEGSEAQRYAKRNGIRFVAQ